MLSELQRLVSIAGPNDTIYIGRTIDFNIEGYELHGNGCTIELNAEMAGQDGIRLVESSVIEINLGDDGEVWCKSRTIKLGTLMPNESKEVVLDFGTAEGVIDVNSKGIKIESGDVLTSEPSYGQFEATCSCGNHCIGCYIKPHYWIICSKCGQLFENTDCNDVNEFYELSGFKQ